MQKRPFSLNESQENVHDQQGELRPASARTGPLERPGVDRIVRSTGLRRQRQPANSRPARKALVIAECAEHNDRGLTSGAGALPEAQSVQQQVCNNDAEQAAHIGTYAPLSSRTYCRIWAVSRRCSWDDPGRIFLLWGAECL